MFFLKIETYIFVVMARIVMMRVMRVELHVSAAVECLQSSEEALQGISLKKRMVFRHTRYVYWKLVVCNKR